MIFEAERFKTFQKQDVANITVYKIKNDTRFFCSFNELVRNMGFVKANFKPEQPIGRILVKQDIQFVQAKIKGDPFRPLPTNLIGINTIPEFLKEFIADNKPLGFGSNKASRYMKTQKLRSYFLSIIIPTLYDTEPVETPEVESTTTTQDEPPLSTPVGEMTLNEIVQQLANILKCPVNEVRVAAKALYCKHNPIINDLFGGTK